MILTNLVVWTGKRERCLQSWWESEQCDSCWRVEVSNQKKYLHLASPLLHCWKHNLHLQYVWEIIIMHGLCSMLRTRIEYTLESCECGRVLTVKHIIRYRLHTLVTIITGWISPAQQDSVNILYFSLQTAAGSDQWTLNTSDWPSGHNVWNLIFSHNFYLPLPPQYIRL